MEVAKTFERNGRLYRPGDALPDDLDKLAVAHYQRYGMVRESTAPTERKPAAPKIARTPRPKPGEASGPTEAKKAVEETAPTAEVVSTSGVETAETGYAAGQPATPDVAGTDAEDSIEQPQG